MDVEECRMAGDLGSYPTLVVDLNKFRHNGEQIVKRCAAAGIKVTGVVKGHNALPPALRLYGEAGCYGLGSSRLEHLAEARRQNLAGPLMVIRIPMLSQLPELVGLADISLNSEPAIIRAINEEAKRQDKMHGVVLMADLGDLREGFWDRDELVKTAIWVERELDQVELKGIGTNLGCYGSIKATPEKMLELIEIAQAVEVAIDRPLDIVSGGGTMSLPLVLQGIMPAGINHLRVGEAIAPARDLSHIWGLDTPFLHQDVFTLQAEIVEIKDKPSYPVGDIFVDGFGKRGNKAAYVDRGIRKRAILAIGKIDFADGHQLDPRLPGVEVIGSSSDHLIVDIEDVKSGLCVGDMMEFDLHYTTVVYLTSSPYVRTVFI
jgi:predicted amino acid racemase